MCSESESDDETIVATPTGHVTLSTEAQAEVEAALKSRSAAAAPSHALLTLNTVAAPVAWLPAKQNRTVDAWMLFGLEAAFHSL